MSDLLFDVPWWLFGSLIIFGGIVGWMGLQKRQKGSIYAGAVLILLAVGLKALSYFVETDKEKCTRQTTELVACVQNRDWTKFSSLLEEGVTLNTGVGAVFANRNELVDGAKDDVDRYKLTSVSGHVVSVQQDVTGVTVDINASSQQDVMSGMSMQVPSSWKLQWEKDGKEWRLHEITCTRIGNESAKEMAGQIRR